MKFLIREFPEALHHDLKVIAVKERKPLYKLIIEILENWNKPKKEKREA